MKKKLNMPNQKQKAKNLSINPTVLLVVTGSIAAYKSPMLVKKLKALGIRVICVMTKNAKEFVTETALRVTSGERVYSDMFPKETEFGVLHTSLSDLADLVLVAPASANFIAKMSTGIADNLPACLVLATKSPVVVAPAMNDNMLTHAITQKNIAQLKAIGYEFADPICGALACGRNSAGHIASDEAILSLVRKKLKNSSLHKN